MSCLGTVLAQVTSTCADCVVGHGSDDHLDVLVELLLRPGLLSHEFGDVKIIDEIAKRCNAIPGLATWRSVGLMLVHG